MALLKTQKIICVQMATKQCDISASHLQCMHPTFAKSLKVICKGFSQNWWKS